MPLPRLIALTRRRWTIPILGNLHRLNGAKFVTLCHRLDAHQGAMRQSLDHLIALNLIERNSGLGHPLRPEYVLTTTGAKLAPACAAVDDLLSNWDLRDVCLRRWSLPVLRVMAEEPSNRFTSIGERVGAITDRALSMALRDLGAASLVARDVRATVPPSSFYRLTRRSERLVEQAMAI